VSAQSASVWVSERVKVTVSPEKEELISPAEVKTLAEEVDDLVTETLTEPVKAKWAAVWSIQGVSFQSDTELPSIEIETEESLEAPESAG